MSCHHKCNYLCVQWVQCTKIEEKQLQQQQWQQRQTNKHHHNKKSTLDFFWMANVFHLHLLMNEKRRVPGPELTKGATNISRTTIRLNSTEGLIILFPPKWLLHCFLLFRLCVVSRKLGSYFPESGCCFSTLLSFCCFFFTISVRNRMESESSNQGTLLSFTHESDKESNTSGHTNISWLYKVFSTTFPNKNK